MAITHSNEAHTYIKAGVSSMAEDVSAKDKTVNGLTDAEQLSVVLKQQLNSLVDMVNESGNSAAAQDLKSAMRCWGGIHRCLAAERKIAISRRDKQNDCAWGIFKEDRALIREQILDLGILRGSWAWI
jgi:hypothetical protein